MSQAIADRIENTCAQIRHFLDSQAGGTLKGKTKEEIDSIIRTKCEGTNTSERVIRKILGFPLRPHMYERRHDIEQQEPQEALYIFEKWLPLNNGSDKLQPARSTDGTRPASDSNGKPDGKYYYYY